MVNSILGKWQRIYQEYRLIPLKLKIITTKYCHFLAKLFKEGQYRFYPKYSDTLTLYHSCSKI